MALFLSIFGIKRHYVALGPHLEFKLILSLYSTSYCISFISAYKSNDAFKTEFKKLFSKILKRIKKKVDTVQIVTK